MTYSTEELEAIFKGLDAECWQCSGQGQLRTGNGLTEYDCDVCYGTGYQPTHAGVELLNFLERHRERVMTQRKDSSGVSEPRRRTGMNTQPAGVHESTTCDAGPGNGPCELCRWVNESVGKSENEQEPVAVTTPAVRAAIADVLDAGDDHTPNHSWLFFNDEGDDETATRMRFLDAVERGLRERKEPD